MRSKDRKWETANQLFVMDRSAYITVHKPQPGIPTLPDIVECTLTFTNTTYPDLPVSLPETIADISGAVIVLPTVTGEYEDTLNYYIPKSWDIGDFGTSITFYQDNLVANLQFTVTPKPVSTYTLTFTNTTYPDLPVSLPDPVTVSGGTTVVLPQVDGEYEDGENIYTPSSWSVGDFNDTITVNEDLTANLLWEVTPIPSGDDINKPLMFLSLEDGSTVKITNNVTSNQYEISYDGETWSPYGLETAITLNEGERLFFRCTYFTPSNNDSRYVHFVLTGKLEAYNNVNSMYSVDFANITALSQPYVFYDLFDSCRSLYRAPLLPATTLSTACYAEMFFACHNLVEAPVLPATTLAVNCYSSMFANCSSLTKAPELPATDLVTSCYYRMFRFCTHLAEIKCAAVNPPSGESTFVGACNEWLSGTAASGTFYADPDASWTSDINGIPSGWTRISL